MMLRRYRMLVVFAAVFLAGAVANAACDFDRGMAAYKRKDYSQALRYWKQCAEEGNAVAQYNLGVMYENGEGVPQDYAEAVKWYRKAAEQGYASAQYNLGVMYDNGEGVPESDAEAVKWYRKAAEQGHAAAQNNLGWMYEFGKGVPQDYAEAVKWYRKAAEQGYAVAQNNLGVMYEFGKGVPQDYAEALRWFNKSAAQGEAFAKGNLRILKKAMEMRRAHPHAPKLFGVPLVGAMRDGMREAVKRAGARPVREKYSYWCDKYDSKALLKGTSELYLCYSADSDPDGASSTDFFAYAEYTFPSFMDVEQVARVRDMVASKYGPPDEVHGMVRVGKVRYVWHRDGVDIIVYRGWPETTTYLKYTVPEMERAMHDEIAEMERKKRQREVKKQWNAF